MRIHRIFYPDRKPSTGAYIVKYVYRPIRVKHLHDNIFELFNTRSFLSGKEFILNFAFNDGTNKDYVLDVPPLSKQSFKIPLGKQVDDNLSVIITTYSKDKKVVCGEQQIIIQQNIKKMIANSRLIQDFLFKDNKVYIGLKGGEVLTSFDEYTLLYRAGTDNDMDMVYHDGMAPYYQQQEKVVSIEETPHGKKIVTEVKNKKGKFLVTDTYEGSTEGILVTSKIHPIKAKGDIPRFGKCFYLPSSFDDVKYIGRSGESYADMKEQFVIKENECKVEDMVEPNIKPQESGNRCDCREATISNKNSKVTFVAIDSSFELGIKPYADRELRKMKHRNDEIRTGTYVTIQAFQRGIGTGSCGPVTADEYRYKADKDYVLKFLIKVD